MAAPIDHRQMGDQVKFIIASASSTVSRSKPAIAIVDIASRTPARLGPIASATHAHHDIAIEYRQTRPRQ